MLLPNEDSPELALYLCPDRQQWYTENVEQSLEAGPYEHGDTIEFGSSQWTFLLVTEDDATTEFSPTQTTLEDEESTNLTLINNGVEIDLGERSHHYLMVHLLRYRTSQADESAWLNNQVLLKELGLEETHMNIQIFRARKQVATALPTLTGHSKLIERRRGSLKVSIKNFEIYKEGVKEA